ncbi:type II toxin-antitoxin system RelE/ParE family toxin [uncultured Sphingomonas sp.]|uniref:type II toxin-antitoxin system RelE family toxin n=1 Tax=uncultured Sphingomonas sp. TaxID=158754 RepID=UPI0035CB81FD
MEIRFSSSAAKALARSHKGALIRSKIDDLEAEPLSQNRNVRRLQGRSEYRLRVQDWRVIFRIENGVLWIDEIAPRGSVY